MLNKAILIPDTNPVNSFFNSRPRIHATSNRPRLSGTSAESRELPDRLEEVAVDPRDQLSGISLDSRTRLKGVSIDGRPRLEGISIESRPRLDGIAIDTRSRLCATSQQACRGRLNGVSDAKKEHLMTRTNRRVHPTRIVTHLQKARLQRVISARTFL